MIHLHQSLEAWGTPRFPDVLKNEVEQLDDAQLPLQAGLAETSYVAQTGYQVMVIGASEDERALHVTIGIFYQGIVAGCSCADDPTPVEAQNEYCELWLDIDKATAETTVALAGD